MLTCTALRLCLEFLIRRCNVVDSTINTTVSENVDVINFLYTCIPYMHAIYLYMHIAYIMHVFFHFFMHALAEHALGKGVNIYIIDS